MGRERVIKPFLDSWLRRTRKQLSGSGKLSELALILSMQEKDATQDEWRSRLQEILDGNEDPSMELLTKLDSLLAKPTGKVKETDPNTYLF